MKSLKTLLGLIPRDRIAFSLVELMISLITISCIAAAFTPVITKKLKKQDVALSLAQTSEISDVCGKDSGKNFGNNTDGYNCKLCTKAYCIQCGLTDCGEGKYIDTKTCTCRRCKEDAGLDNCLACKIENSEAVCTMCQKGNGNKGTGFYLQKEGESKPQKTCRTCGSNNYCDDGVWEKTVSQCANPPSGYVCINNKFELCSVVHNDSKCTRCTESKCTACGEWYYLNPSSGKCESCGPNNCTACSSYNVCTSCSGYNLLNEETRSCTAGCKPTLPNCQLCSGTIQGTHKCVTCDKGYYTDSNGNCIECIKPANCGYPSRSDCSKCEVCNEGYFLTSSKTCQKCPNIANCVACENASECIACKNGYSLSKDRKKCLESSGFCMGQSFMQVGNLCVTRRNMGDSSVLKIPSTVTVVDTKEYCPGTSGTPCCWNGQYTTECHANNSGYSGCNRTLCNWDAAYEICKNFNYAGKQWRLAKLNEINWSALTFGLGTDGLQICIANPTTNPTKYDRCCNSTKYDCFRDYSLKIAGCGAYRYWLEGDPKTRRICWYSYEWDYEIHGNGCSVQTGDEPRGVRCVTELE